LLLTNLQFLRLVAKVSSLRQANQFCRCKKHLTNASPFCITDLIQRCNNANPHFPQRRRADLSADCQSNQISRVRQSPVTRRGIAAHSSASRAATSKSKHGGSGLS